MKVKLLLFLFLISTVYGQEYTGGLDVVQIKSPQVADMMRFDQVTSPLASGRIVTEIPLINFQDPDFDFPISIRYNSGGFKPSTPNNFVGMNWSLSCGGVIYREVKGMPDDVEDVITGHSEGFLNNVKNPIYNKALIEELLESNPNSILYSDIKEDFIMRIKDANHKR